MSAKVMGHVYELDLSPNEQSVLLALADHADHNGKNIYPSIGLIAWKTGYEERQVRRIITALCTSGLLVQERPASPRTPALYHIDLTAGTLKQPYIPGQKSSKKRTSHSHNTKPTDSLDSLKATIQGGHFDHPEQVEMSTQGGHLNHPGWTFAESEVQANSASVSDETMIGSSDNHHKNHHKPSPSSSDAPSGAGGDDDSPTASPKPNRAPAGATARALMWLCPTMSATSAQQFDALDECAVRESVEHALADGATPGAIVKKLRAWPPTPGDIWPRATATGRRAAPPIFQSTLPDAEACLSPAEIAARLRARRARGQPEL